MTTLILVRHGRTTANATGVLAGRTKGVKLDDLGREQAARAGERLAALTLTALVTSPLERTRETAAAIGSRQRVPIKASTDRSLIECDYGDWQGQTLATLTKDKLWRTVQQQPSAVTFPGGESMVDIAARAVTGVRRRNAQLSADHGEGAIWAAVSHGDVIKAIVGEALGQHLDLFQRIIIDPASITVIRYTADRPYVLAVNTHDGDLGHLAPTKHRKTKKSPDAVLGGGAGPSPAGSRS